MFLASRCLAPSALTGVQVARPRPLTATLSMFPALHPNMRRKSIRVVAALLLAVAVMLGSGAVRWTTAVPFASLSPQPQLRLFMAPPGNIYMDLCVISASGLGISSITAADLAQFAGRDCNSVPVNTIDLRPVTMAGSRSAGSAHCG